MHTRPPRMADRLLKLLLRGEQGAAFHGDLEEAFRKRLGEAGRAVARAWYWKQVFSVFLWQGRERLRSLGSLNVHVRSSFGAGMVHWLHDLGRDARLAGRNLLRALPP